MPKTKLSISLESTEVPYIGRDKIFLELIGKIRKQVKFDHSVDVIYGLGGIGKSRTLKELQKNLFSDNNLAFAKIDFRYPESRQRLNFLIQLRHKFGNKYGIPFPSFDIAFTSYWRLKNPHIPLSKKEIKFLKQAEITGEIISILEDVPFLGTLAKIPRVMNSLSETAKEWWHKRGNLELQRLIGIENVYEIFEWLPVLWASDITSWSKKTNKKIVLFIDTYEALWDKQVWDDRGVSIDEWVRDLAGHLKGVHLVICGQRKLLWETQDKSWKGYIEHIQLSGIEPIYIESLLASQGIKSELLIKSIIQKSHGVPIYLEEFLRLYKEFNENKISMDITDFHNVDFSGIIKRFLSFKTTEQKQVLFLLSVPNYFDYKLFGELIKAFGVNYPTIPSAYENLANLTTIELFENDYFSIHELVRAILTSLDDRESRDEVHSFLFKYYCDRLTKESNGEFNLIQRLAFQEAIYHSREVNEPTVTFKWLTESIENYYDDSNWDFFKMICENQIPYFAKNFGDLSAEVVELHSIVADCVETSGKTLEAIDGYKELLLKYEEFEDKQEIVLLGLYLDLGGALRRGGYSKESEDLLTKAENISTSNDDKFLRKICSIKNELQIVYQNKEDYQKGIQKGTEALKLLDKLELSDGLRASVLINLAQNMAMASIGNVESLCFAYAQEALNIALEKDGEQSRRYLKIKVVLGQIYYLNDEFEKALQVLEETSKIQAIRLGDNDLDYLKTLKVIIEVYEFKGSDDGVDELYKEILSSLRDEYGDFHPEVLSYTHMIARDLLNKQEYEQVEKLYVDMLQENALLLETNHPVILKVKLIYGELLTEMGKFIDSERYLSEALYGMREYYGNDHNLTLECMSNLSRVKRNLNKNVEAEALLKEAIDMRKSQSENHAQLIPLINNLGLYYWDRGQNDKAEKCFQESIDLVQSFGSKFRTLELQARANITMLNENNNEIENSKKTYKNIFEESLEYDGLYDTYTQYFLECYITFLVKKQQLQSLFALRGQLEEISNSKTDLTQSLVDQFKLNISQVYLHTDMEEKALALLKEVIGDQSDGNRKVNKYSLQAFEELYKYHKKQNDFDFASKYVKDILELTSKLYGKQHYKYTGTLQGHIQFCELNKRYAEMSEGYEMLLSYVRNFEDKDYNILFWTLLHSSRSHAMNGTFEKGQKHLEEAYELIDKKKVTDKPYKVNFSLANFYLNFIMSNLEVAGQSVNFLIDQLEDDSLNVGLRKSILKNAIAYFGRVGRLNKVKLYEQTLQKLNEEPNKA
ncbi:tetratricopeptide repeat protein [Flagellimonas sp.]|uniref:tetratricopeptide repeat protein n=1 Tax=Flagellimonas sp. TaxID=2058762 RepID=UPI003B524B4F